MSSNTEIEWAKHTFNPWWGCYEQSPACDNCYARELANRFGVKWGADELVKFASEKQWGEPHRWQRAAERKSTRYRVFCQSMGDIMDPRSFLQPHRERLYRIIEETPRLDWLLLTKQPRKAMGLLPKSWRENGCPGNVWFGATAENPEWLARRAGWLLEIPAVVHFLSMEPLLARTTLTDVVIRGGRFHGMRLDVLRGQHIRDDGRREVVTRGIDWVIVGGESGRKPRPMHPTWARAIQAECSASQTPFFFKQWGNWVPVSQAPLFMRKEKPTRFMPPDDVSDWMPEMLEEPEMYDFVEAVQESRLIRLRSKKDTWDRLDGKKWDEVPRQARLVA